MKIKLYSYDKKTSNKYFEFKKEISGAESLNFVGKIVGFNENRVYDLNALIEELFLTTKQQDLDLLRKFKSSFKIMSLDTNSSPSFVTFNITLMDECDNIEYNESDIKKLQKLLLSESWIETR